MRVIDTITLTSHGRVSRIELCGGDLTLLESGENVDLLVVSAFPGDYVPTASSLIGALERKGPIGRRACATQGGRSQTRLLMLALY